MCVYQNVNGTPCEQQIDEDFQLQRETFCTCRLLCTKRYRTIKRSHNAALFSFFFFSSNTARRGKQSKAVGWQSVKINNRSNKQAVVLHRSYSVQVTNIQIHSSATIIFKAKLNSTVGLASLRYISTLLHICKW